ncbi:MAG: SET domain-containing protein-lysine N-methyltransferase [Saprospiraceae bacterium]|nr:SET domain-containing protein-lysine N-methyltransferase [Saprospiraceae bacterium]MBK7810228.1 SET domain-containing protein-lysine N-methyltransferase [Saprospiraceae bacterium]MBK9629831.1 SET domain-containing protein-lysine N-methyltransferase [Saprospiraceae bacterium]
MKICVLQADYGNSTLDYRLYDPPRNLSHWWPEASFHHEFLHKLTVYKQLRDLSKQNFDIYINLCEGYLEWDIPSIDVIYALDHLNLPYTGPTIELYDPPKDLMKYIAYCEGISTPEYAIIESDIDLKKLTQALNYPLFIKPLKSGDSLGIDQSSKLENYKQLSDKVQELLPFYPKLLVEEYIGGREFTVLVVATPTKPEKCISLLPVEYKFPEGFSYKTYSLKTSELHPDANLACNDPYLEVKLKKAASKIFEAFSGVGYGRMDFRVNDKNEIYFLEVNFTCSVFYPEGFEGSADHILRIDGLGQSNFLKAIVQEGMLRYQAKKKRYEMRGNAIAGFGIYALENFKKGDIIFQGEERAQRIVTKRYVDDHWDEQEKIFFRQYAYPLSNEVYCLWDKNPTEWAPQNHSCEPNTFYIGLNVVASKNIIKGEELTLDYSEFLDEHAESFECMCGSKNCKRWIQGKSGNNVSVREEIMSERK